MILYTGVFFFFLVYIVVIYFYRTKINQEASCLIGGLYIDQRKREGINRQVYMYKKYLE